MVKIAAVVSCTAARDPPELSVIEAFCWFLGQHKESLLDRMLVHRKDITQYYVGRNPSKIIYIPGRYNAMSPSGLQLTPLYPN